MTARMRRRRRLSATVLVTAVSITAMAAVDAESRGSASTATLPAAAHARVSTRLPEQPAQPPASVTSPSRPAGAARPTLVSPCANNRRAQLIVVSISRQHAWACAEDATVLSTPVTTGATDHAGDATPRGTFAVQGLDRNTVLTTSAAGRYRVKYWIPFHLGVWGFHDASWQKIPFGSKRYTTRGSHGCVHMPLAAIRWLFHWVHYGTAVRIT